MLVYVAEPLAETARAQDIQAAVVAAGHELTLDWTRGPDVTFTDAYVSRTTVSARLASDDLDAVLAADAVLVVASERDGRGMFVELGSVFFHHPAVRHGATVAEWLSDVAP